MSASSWLVSVPWIAAVCIANGFPLATGNFKNYEDFAAYHGLVLTGR